MFKHSFNIAFLILHLALFLPVCARSPAAAETDSSDPQAIYHPVDAGSSESLRLFGTVELQRPLNFPPGWPDSLPGWSASPAFDDSRCLDREPAWAGLRNSLSGKSPLEQLRQVNSFWNKCKYRGDEANGDKAHLQGCFNDDGDYALSKYLALKEIGLDPEKMRIVLVRDTVRNLPHAVLAVYLEKDVFIMDSLGDAVLAQGKLGNYIPQYSFNEHSRWAHVKGKD